jgi:hypothetical protein
MPTIASKETLDSLVRTCFDSQKKYLAGLLERCRARADFSPYTRITGIEIDEPLNIADAVADKGAKALTPGYYSAKIEFPTAEELGSGRVEFLDWLKGYVMDSIVLPNLKGQDAKSVYRYVNFRKPAEGSAGLGLFDDMILSLSPEGYAAFDNVAGKIASQIFEVLSRNESKFAPGQKVFVAYEIDREGNADVYRADMAEHTFTVPVGMIEDDSDKDTLKQVLAQVIEDKVVHPYLISHRFPEIARFVIRAPDGRRMISPEGQEYLGGFIERATEQLAECICALPYIKEGALLRVHADEISPKGLFVNPKFRQVVLDPDKEVAIRSYLPDTIAMDEDEKDAVYEKYAADLALTVIANNMIAAPNPHVKEYLSVENVGTEEEPGHAVSLTDRGRMVLGKAYENVVDEAYMALVRLREERPVPVYFDIAVQDFPDGDGPQDVKAKTAKLVYLNSSGEVDVPPLIINCPEITEGVLNDEALLDLSAEAVDKVISNVILPHMASNNHNRIKDCFIPDGKEEGMIYLTEEGAKTLKPLIEYLSAEVAVEVLKMRLFVPEHFRGYRAMVPYRVGSDDRLIGELVPINELFFLQENSVEFYAADVSKQLSELPGREEDEKWNDYLEDIVARDLVVRMIQTNMEMAEHPGRNAYFMAGEKGLADLTDEGEHVLGHIVERFSKSLAGLMKGYDGITAGAHFRLDYMMHLQSISFNLTRLDRGSKPDDTKEGKDRTADSKYKG